MPPTSHASDVDTEIDPEVEVEVVAETDTGAEETQVAWAEAAREVLLKTARSYGSLITQQKLATQIQDRTDLHTDRQIRHWLGAVLRMVAEDSAARDEPLLIALVVDARGSVGDLYAKTLLDLRGEEIDHVDDHAARERLACHEYFGANMPSGGVSRRWRPRWPPPAPAPARRRPRSGSSRSARTATPRCPRPGCATTAGDQPGVHFRVVPGRCVLASFGGMEEGEQAAHLSDLRDHADPGHRRPAGTVRRGRQRPSECRSA